MRHLSDHSFFPAMPPVLGPSTCHLSPRRRRLQENCAPSNVVIVKVNTKGSIPSDEDLQISSERPITIWDVVKAWLCQPSRIWPKCDVTSRQRPMRTLVSFTSQIEI